MRGANYLERASETPEDWYYTNANGVAFSPEERERLRAGKRGEAAGRPPLPQELVAPAYAEVAGLDDTTRMQYVDLFFWLVGDILLKTDKMSMAHSLESRVPFLDKRVFEVSATVPTRLKADNEQTKLALREAAERAIPKDWAQKEKLGFPVPVVSWLRQDRYYDQVKREFESQTAERFFNTGELVRLLDEHRAGADARARSGSSTCSSCGTGSTSRIAKSLRRRRRRDEERGRCGPFPLSDQLRGVNGHKMPALVLEHAQRAVAALVQKLEACEPGARARLPPLLRGRGSLGLARRRSGRGRTVRALRFRLLVRVLAAVRSLAVA